MEPQEKDLWCWVAVAVSISKFYNLQSLWTQCELANKELSRSDCCNPGFPCGCNVAGRLDGALTRVGNFQATSFNPASYQDIVQEIDKAKPVCAKVQWVSSGSYSKAHYVALIGYRTRLSEDGLLEELVVVTDPDATVGETIYPYEKFKQLYEGDGMWVHTYTTKQ